MKETGLFSKKRMQLRMLMFVFLSESINKNIYEKRSFNSIDAVHHLLYDKVIMMKLNISLKTNAYF
jgi:hypothetical protein